MKRSLAVVVVLALVTCWGSSQGEFAPQKGNAAAKGRPADKVIHLKTTLPCKPTEAFALFTDKKRLASWLTEEADVEPRVGGKYELFWDLADRENNSTLGCRVTAVEPGQLLAFEWKSPRQFKKFANVADPLTHVVVAFIPSGEQTIVHLTHSGWRSSAQWEEARKWQERAWGHAFTALRKQAARPK